MVARLSDQARTTVPDYDAMIAVLATRREQRNISFTDLDELAGVATGYSSKALGGSQTAKLGWLSTFLILPALGMRLVLEVDEEAAAMFDKRITPRQANQARPNNYASRAGKRQIQRVFRHFSAKGGKARMRKMTAEERSEHQRRAANARWFAERKKRKRARGAPPIAAVGK